MKLEEKIFDKKYEHNCKKCHEFFIYESDDIRWIENGMYSEKVVKCPHCGCINVIKYKDGFNQNPNLNRRYFK